MSSYATAVPSGTASVDGSGGVDAPPSPACCLSSRLHCSPLFVHIQLFPCGAAAADLHQSHPARLRKTLIKPQLIKPPFK